MNKPHANGDELCKVIEEFSELEWRRFQMREIKVKLRNGDIYQQDNSTFPPFTSVRFKKENTEFVEKLKKAVEGYQGNLVWKMFSHQRMSEPNVNWVIRPAIVDQVIDAAGGQDIGNWQRYMSDHSPDFALKAYADFLELAKYVREELKNAENLKGP